MKYYLNYILYYFDLNFLLAGSKAHKILHARTDHTRLSYFLEAKSLSNVEAVKYGIQTEEKARNRYIEITNHDVKSIGLFVSSKFPWLAASPDGLFKIDTELALLEIKCPFSCKDSTLRNIPYLDKDGNLKKTHVYYTQIQLTAWICGCKIAYLFLYTSKDQKILEIKLDEPFV